MLYWVYYSTQLCSWIPPDRNLSGENDLYWRCTRFEKAFLRGQPFVFVSLFDRFLSNTCIYIHIHTHTVAAHDDLWKYHNIQATFSSYFPYIEDSEQILHKFYYTPVAPRNFFFFYKKSPALYLWRRCRTLYIGKRALCIRKRPFISAKMPCISAKEPCISAKEPCISAKVLYIST